MSKLDVKETTVYTSAFDGNDDPNYIERVKDRLTNTDPDPLKQYLLVSQLGEGGSGIIYNAHEKTLDRDLAIKVLKEKFRKSPLAVRRFLREAKTTAKLEHPSIVPVHELGYAEDYGCYFSMQKISGESLQTILRLLQQGSKRLQKKYNPIKLLEIFIKVCQGVAYAHSKKVIHRDLKPENIIVGRFGQVLIIDWGLAKKIEKDPMKETEQCNLSIAESGDVSQTVHGTINGTPTNMSPEQACGMQDGIGFKSDIYSLGTILYEILCYHAPFEDTQLHTVLNKVVSGNFVPPSKKNKSLAISKELEAITIKAMETNPFERYDTVKDLIHDVRNAIGNLPVSAYKAPLHHSLFRLMQRHRIVTATLTSIFVGIIFSLFFVRIKSSVRIKTNLETAETLVAEAVANMGKAKSIYNRLTIESDESLVDKYQRELKDAEVEISSQITASLALYESAGRRMLKPNFALNKARPILRQLIDYSIETQQPELLEHSIDLAENWCGQKVYPAVITDKDHYDVIANYLKGNGVLTLKIKPPALKVEVYSIAESNNGSFTKADAPILTLEKNNQPTSIPKGMYVAHIKTDIHDQIIYSFKIEHIESEKIQFNVPPTIPTGMIFIPGGPAWIGGPYSSHHKLINQTIPSFFIKKTEVTFGEYYEFWKTLDSLEKNRYCPYIQLSENIKSYVPAWDKNGNYSSFCSPDLPVVGVTHEAADEFCEWLSAKEKKKFRLPTNHEWEKAARGGDCRNFVWGNNFAPQNALSRSNTEAKAKYKYWAKCGVFPKDKSIYGVLDMAGNIREWTSTKFRTEDTFYLIKGSSAFTPDNFLYCEAESYTSFIPSDVGFRYIQEIDNKDNYDY